MSSKINNLGLLLDEEIEQLMNESTMKNDSISSENRGAAAGGAAAGAGAGAGGAAGSAASKM